MPAGDISCVAFVAVLAKQAGGSGDSMSLLDYAPIVIAAVSLIVTSAVGLLNRATAKRALVLAERQEARRESRVELQVEESLSWRRPGPTARLLGFRVVVTNPTDRGNSLIGADLRLAYNVDRVATTVKIPCIEDASTLNLPARVTPIELPARVDPNDALSGWLVFTVPNGLTRQRPIEHYDVVIRDVYATEEAFRVIWLQEIADDETG